MPFGSEGRQEGIALAMSGGGFRAVLFHVGSLWRLNEAGILGRLSRISSVSGGSIAAGLLAVRWNDLQFTKGEASNFRSEIVKPLREFCDRNLDSWSVISGAFNPCKTAGEEVADAYRTHLGMSVKVSQLPASGPRFVFNATNFATGASFRFSKPYCGDYRIGLIEKHDFDVALAVACSSAFPPVLSPMEVDVDPGLFVRTKGADLFDRPGFRQKLLLADGGVYDNLGLETVWGRYSTVLVSDAGAPFELDAGVSAIAHKQILRVMDIGLTQALALRKRMLIEAYMAKQAKGAYWGIATPMSKYPMLAKLPVAGSKSEELSAIRTRLNKFNEREQCELINWGYASTDAALGSHLPQEVGRAAQGLPYPAFPLF